MRREGKGSKIWGKIGTKWDIAVMGQTDRNLQLVDVIHPLSEGREGPELASGPYYACCKGRFGFLDWRNCTFQALSFNGK